jgi:hypothetical protein
MAVSPRMGRAKNCIGVVLDKNAEGFSGHVTNRFQKDSVEFTDLPELFSRIIEVLDTLNYPARKINKRQFKGGVPAGNKFKINEDQGPIIDTADLLGGQDGFIIMVVGRDNGTMQGTVYDSALDKDFKFNGDIELYRILYNK